MIPETLKNKYDILRNNRNIAQEKIKNKELNKTLKSVLINNHIKNTNENISFDEIQDSLLITDSSSYYLKKEKEEENGFNENNALKPIITATGILFAGVITLSSMIKLSSKNLLKTMNFEQLPELATNMNIKEETHFAIYRAIRDPNTKNILGAAAVFLMSGITIAAKNFVDGTKEIWLKKQAADIERDLQENLIKVETDSFSGKLNVVNDMLNQNIKYFDSVLNNKKINSKNSQIFSEIISFKSEHLNGVEKSIAEGDDILNQNSEAEEKNRKDKKRNIKYGLLLLGVLLGAYVTGKISFKNIKKTIENTEKYATNYVEKTIEAIDIMKEKSDPKDLPRIKELLQSICAKPEYVREIGQKYNLSEEEIREIIESVKEVKKTIFADAPTALGGIPKKIQYYCYIDENRGHLYNWIMNPDNKFTKYLFMSCTIASSIGYIFKEGMDAIKEVTVLKENSKTELNLRKRLVDVEISNFKSKKNSAIRPLIEDFTKQAESGQKTKEELKVIADNILTETKNGPPYVYT